MTAADLTRALGAFIEAAAPDRGAVAIRDLTPAPAGSSTENWFFDADWGQGPLPLLLRRAPESEVVQVDRSAEFGILDGLADTGVPSPRAYWQGSLGGRPAMILERCSGRADRLALTERNRLGLDEHIRIALAKEVAQMLARLHVQPVPESAADPVEASLAPYRSITEALPDEMATELRVGLWWLEDNRPDARAWVMVHGDYRPANMLIKDGRITALLDWEFAHCGDPHEDLGWYLADVYRRHHFIPGRFSPEHFLQLYEAESGIRADHEKLAWWAVFALQKLATIAVETLMAFRQGDDGRIIQSPDRHLSALMRAVARGGTLEGLA